MQQHEQNPSRRDSHTGTSDSPASFPPKEHFLSPANKPRSYYVERWIQKEYLKSANLPDTDDKDTRTYTASTLKLYAKELHRFVAFIFKNYVEGTINPASYSSTEEKVTETNKAINRAITDNPQNVISAYLSFLAKNNKRSATRAISILRKFYSDLRKENVTNFQFVAAKRDKMEKFLPKHPAVTQWIEYNKDLTARYNQDGYHVVHKIRSLFKLLHYLTDSTSLSASRSTVRIDWPEDIMSRLLENPEDKISRFFKIAEEHYSKATVISLKSNIRLFYIWANQNKHTTFDFQKWESPELGSILPNQAAFRSWASKVGERISSSQKNGHRKGISEGTAKNYIRLIRKFLDLASKELSLDSSDQAFPDAIANLHESEIKKIMDKVRQSAGNQVHATMKVCVIDFYSSLGRKVNLQQAA